MGYFYRFYEYLFDHIHLYLLGRKVSAVLGVFGTGVLLIDTNILLDLSSTESFSFISDTSEEAVLRRELSEFYKESKTWTINGLVFRKHSWKRYFQIEKYI